VLRPAESADADAIDEMMRAALNAFGWMPLLHTPENNRAFPRNMNPALLQGMAF
jgi:hypothetical protein